LAPDLSQDYAAWRAVEFPAGQVGDDLVSGPDADPDRDGMSNWLEYQLGRRPLVAESWFDLFEFHGESLSIDYRVNSHATGGATGLEMSGDLAHWTRPGRARLIGRDADGNDRMQVELPPTDSDRLFFRIEASSTP
jgi:hypothetical protein